jgi:hypothetical protein
MRLACVTLALATILAGTATAQDEAPWAKNAADARARAIAEGKPCVLIINVDSGAC